MKKKLLSLLLALSLCLALLPPAALAAEDPQGLAPAETSTVVEVSMVPERPAEEADTAAVDQAAPAEEAEADPVGQTVPAEAVGPEIASAKDLGRIADGVYRLTADIELTGAWTPIQAFSGTLDGDGHTITLDGPPLFDTIAESGRVVNLVLDGTAAVTEGEGPMALTNQGTIHNCASNVTNDVKHSWDTVSGLVGTHSGGYITNCVVTGTIGGSISKAIATGAPKGTIDRCYWDLDINKGITLPSFVSPTVTNCAGMPLADLKSTSFLAVMDVNRGDDGLSWGLDEAGLPVPGGQGRGLDVDKAALRAAVTAAESYANDPDDPYDHSLWTAFAAARDEARELLGSDAVAQSQVDDAEKALTDAQSALKKLDRTALWEKIGLAEAKKNPEQDGTRYTKASWAALEAALEQAGALTSGVEVTQAQVDAAGEALDRAVAGLKIDLSGSVDRKALAAALAAAAEKTGLYTADTYAGFSDALARAQAVHADETKDQAAVDGAAQTLSAATAALAERTFPSLTPPQGSDWISITTVDQFMNMEAGKYYRLDEDLTLLTDEFNGFETVKMWRGIPLDAVLNGNGHVVTLGGKYTTNFFEAVYSTGVFTNIGAAGAVYDLGVIGHVYPRSDMGRELSPLAKSCSGLVFNCYSWATVQMPSGSGGLVTTLESGGAIHNSYAAADQSGFGGGLTKSAAGNSRIENGFWRDQMSATSGGGEAKTDRELAGEAFRTLLNEGKGTAGLAWNQSGSGRPWHGAEQDYGPPEPIRFTLTDSKGEVLATFDGIDTDLTLSALDGDDSGYIGALSYSRDPKAAFQRISGSAVSVLSNGRMTIEGAGTAKVGAYDPDVRDPLQHTYTKLLASFTVTVEQAGLAEVRMVVSPAMEGAEVVDRNGVWTTAGSSGMICRVEGRPEGQETYRNVSRYFDFSASETLAVYTQGMYGDAVATPKVPGKGWVRATSKAGALPKTMTVEIETDSTYVPVERLSLDLPETYTLHTRQAATTEAPGRFGYPHLGTLWPKAVPANASYAPSLYYSKWTISSSDESIAHYQESMVYNLVAEQAGTVTITATLTDPGYGDVPGREVTHDQDITFVYKNPITAIRMEEGPLTVKAGESVSLPLVLEGELTAAGYGLSMADMEWTTEGTGQVRLLHDPVVVKGRDDTDGVNSFVANPEWKVLGTKVGTVKVTGTPVDQTNKVGSVTFTVHVTEGEEKPPVDHASLVAQGIAGAQKYITAKYEDKEPAYNSEWDVFAMSRSGGSLSAGQRSAYLDSAEAWLKANLTGAAAKPTDIERVALAVGALGEDLTSFRGMDILGALMASGKIADGSNESAYALLVLDSRAYPAPEGALWTRDGLIDELIDRYQSADGGFGLTDAAGTGVDTTAYALQALAPYHGSNEKVKTAVDKGLDYLRDQQKPNGGFSNVEAAGQVLTALAALGLDPLDEANGFVQPTGDLVTAIMAHFDEATGGFYHVTGDDTITTDPMATVQSLYSLEAYRRYRAGEDRLYDLTPVTARASLVKRVEAAEGLKEPDYTAATWAPFASALKAAKELLADQAATDQALKAADSALADAAAGLKKESGGSGGGTGGKIGVTFRLIGSSRPSEDIDLTEKGKDYFGAEYQNWIKSTSYTMEKGDTVYDLFTQALDDAGLDYTIRDENNYVESITAPAGYGGFELREFANGPRSGWMYTIGGKHPNVGLSTKKLTDGDEVLWHYVNDYSYEVSDWGGNHSGGQDFPALGDASTWDPWLKVRDTDPPTGGAGGNDTGKDGEVSAEVRPEAAVDKKTGEAKAAVTEQEIAGAIAEARKNAAANIVIAPTVKGGASKVSVELPKTSVADIARDTGAKLTVQTSIASLSIPNGALSELAKESGKTVTISAEALRDKDGKATGRIRIEVKAGEKALDSWKGGLTVALPMERPTSGTVLMAVADEGARIVQKSAVDGKTLTALLEGSATVMTKDNSKRFSDVPSDSWAADAVAFAASHELFRGTGEDSFSPGMPMSRAMLVTVLHRLEGEAGTDKTVELAGVERGSWYTAAADWAAANEIVTGTGAGFDPEGDVTRESLAAMLYRYAKAMGVDTAAKPDAMAGFADAGSVSGWSAEAMGWAVSAGLIAGGEDKTLDPSGTATRAEVAAILQRFIPSLIG